MTETGAAFELPDGKRMAVLFNIAYEAWAAGATPGIGPMGNPLPAGAFDTQAASWGEYGFRRGIWRLIEVLDRTGINASVFASGCLAEYAPDSLRALAESGHEVAAHGYSQHVIPALLHPEEEEQDVARCVKVLSEATGTPPRGWLSPRGTPSADTARIVAGHGMEWFGDVFDEDEPYLLSTPAGALVAIPLKMEVNDLPLHMRHGNAPRVFLEVFNDTFDAMYDRGGDGCFLDVTVHAHVFGRPHGAWTVEAIAKRVAAYSDVWVPTRLEMARWMTKQAQPSPRGGETHGR